VSGRRFWSPSFVSRSRVPDPERNVQFHLLVMQRRVPPVSHQSVNPPDKVADKYPLFIQTGTQTFRCRQGFHGSPDHVLCEVPCGHRKIKYRNPGGSALPPAGSAIEPEPSGNQSAHLLMNSEQPKKRIHQRGRSGLWAIPPALQ